LYCFFNRGTRAQALSGDPSRRLLLFLRRPYYLIVALPDISKLIYPCTRHPLHYPLVLERSATDAIRLWPLPV